MFFRRRKVPALTFADRLERLEHDGFRVQQDGSRKAVAVRNGCAAVVEDAGGPARIGRLGVILGNEIAELVDGGYQKFWQTPSGKRAPSRAEELQAMHQFEEDLREALGLVSRYNQSLGTVNASHDYDRVAGRE